jgi:hypothetical protein
MTPPTLPFDDAERGDELVDEAISARLDEDFDAWALDHHVDSTTALAALESRTDFQRRRDALESARQWFRHDDVTALDELTRTRLVRNALDAVAPRRSGRHVASRWSIAAAVAAVFVVAGTIGVLATRSGSDGTHTASAPRTLNNSPSAAPYRGDIGDVSDPDTLRSRIGVLEPVPGAAKAGSGAAVTSTGIANADIATTAPPTTVPGPNQGTSPSETFSQGAAAATPLPLSTVEHCARVRLAQTVGGHVTETATGTYRGVRVVVVVIVAKSRSITSVLDGSTCAPLASQSSKVG